MSHFETPEEPAPQDSQPLSALDDDVPARRLLAHDLEHLLWDHDGESSVPPPD